MADLEWGPGLLDDDIVVRVRNGVVTLGGFVDCSGDRSEVERSRGGSRVCGQSSTSWRSSSPWTSRRLAPTSPERCSILSSGGDR
jgi:hypothetical protein